MGALAFGPIRPAWPVWSSIDIWALAIAGVAVVAVFRLRLGVIPTLALCCGLGLLVRTLAAV